MLAHDGNSQNKMSNTCTSIKQNTDLDLGTAKIGWGQTGRGSCYPNFAITCHSKKCFFPPKAKVISYCTVTTLNPPFLFRGSSHKSCVCMAGQQDPRTGGEMYRYSLVASCIYLGPNFSSILIWYSRINRVVHGERRIP